MADRSPVFGRAAAAAGAGAPPRRGRAPRGDGEATRLHLLRTAEELFAERGIGPVSLRDIHDASGQRNASAVNYHFGGKDGLLRAVIDWRAATTNARRRELLDGLDRTGAEVDVRVLVGVLVRPHADEVAAGTHYLGLLARLITEPDRDRPFLSVSEPVWSSATEVGRRLRRLLPQLEPEVFALRFRLVMDLVIHALADHQNTARRHPGAAPPLDTYVGRLVDAVAGLLEAPACA